MKLILKLLLVLMVMSCYPKYKQSEPNETAVKNKTSLSSTQNVLDFYSESVLTQIDAEELCEFNFDYFLPQLNQKLSENGLKLNVQIADDYESSFEVAINGRTVRLYNQEELSNGKFWDSGPRNFFRIINRILQDENVDKQFYLLYGGNDLDAIFLNKEQFQLMSEINKDNKKEIPYSP